MEALYMALGGALGALGKAVFTTDQDTLTPGVVWRVGELPSGPGFTL
jgi:hypothetical protein